MSVSAWARKYNLKPATVLQRVRDGMSIQDALFSPHYRVERVAIGGESHTIKEWAEICGISDAAMYERRRRGRKDRDLVVERMVTYELTAFGRTQKITEWAKEFGLTGSMIVNRLRRGWTVEDAVSKPRVKNNETLYPKIKAFGQEKSIAQWSRDTGLSEQTIASRLKRSGWPPEKALSTPPLIKHEKKDRG